mmetsp:Transcript_19102/g.43299  ORF Transcript_19102/g.43299 Transcript_19102/m.43299 type:complete len:108 (+) Transcript_19102:85-408(+)|eukprot:CAMPEP_0172599726 /NCGR_PEP_ID=MMETSP1068-20121228/19846_1 /TAXON_ID=35684 /ORGANISM="Pseudopedinella elastica, Strain CCMP716" /LENGTH=107 /DNA_ID=CAMNT_0013400081 /DNA_START=78 /DNA_END=401 /DNA_ORIENTATION=-
MSLKLSAFTRDSGRVGTSGTPRWVQQFSQEIAEEQEQIRNGGQPKSAAPKSAAVMSEPMNGPLRIEKVSSGGSNPKVAGLKFLRPSALSRRNSGGNGQFRVNRTATE